MRIPELPLLERLLQQGDTFIDGGANIGLYALPAARNVGAEGRVIAFEPAQTIAAALEENADLNGFSCITVRKEALADSEGSRPFTTFAGDAAGWSSFAPLVAGGVSSVVRVTTLDTVENASESAS